MMSLELSPPVTFQLRAGSGPVFLSGQECHDDILEEEEEEEEEEEDEEEDEDEDDEDEDDDVDVSLEETPAKPGKRLISQRQTSVAKTQPERQEPCKEGQSHTQSQKAGIQEMRSQEWPGPSDHGRAGQATPPCRAGFHGIHCGPTPAPWGPPPEAEGDGGTGGTTQEPPITTLRIEQHLEGRVPISGTQ
ncbi:nucleophosmin/nucleoplasmin 2 [Phyllostomus discolor]|uniref:Nucleophosmin/nucleoplasmin 2 n=1 Tax=Phyllostomus discolor TaxID=89673 RepID=A0A834DTV8_9CHIR|nr:nucleophosmin/nucleoplasmin 2 [Phyllostomus discolor]